MANIITKQTKDDPKDEGREPSGPMESFYLGRSIRGVALGKAQSIPISINGFTRYAEMGEDNEMEKEFVDVLEQAASTMLVPDLDKYDPGRGGVPRRQGLPAEMKVEYLGDFEMRREHKVVKDVRATETITVPGGRHKRRLNYGPKKFQPVLPDEPAPSVSGEAQKED